MPSEQEAERAAHQVMAGGGSNVEWSLSKVQIGASLQRKCACGGSAGAEEKMRGAAARNGKSYRGREARRSCSAGLQTLPFPPPCRPPFTTYCTRPASLSAGRFETSSSPVLAAISAACVFTPMQQGPSPRARSMLWLTRLAITLSSERRSIVLAFSLTNLLTSCSKAPHPLQPDSANPSGLSPALPDRGPLPRLQAERGLQRSPANSTSIEPEATVPGSGPGLIVDDAARAVGPHQMRKSPFLNALRGAVSSVAAETVAGRVSGTLGAPALDRVFSSYGRQNASELESNVRQYAPGAASAASARDYISSVVARARGQFEEMRKTGKLPEDADLPGAPGEEASSGSPAKEASPPLAKKSEMGGSATEGNTRGIQNQLGSGARIESGLRGRMESAFGADFGKVRFHTDAAAARTSRNVNARAFTIGHDVAFAAGEYQPGTLIGDALIAHELAHVVQQGGHPEAPAGGAAYNSLEEDADTSAIGAVASLWGMAKAGIAGIAANALPSLRSGLRLQCCPEYQFRRSDFDRGF